VWAAERRIKAARFPVIKTLDSFDFTAQPSINQALVRQLMSGEYIDRKENVLLVGNSGTGKTHLASAPSGAPRAWPSRPAPRGGGCGSSPLRPW